MKIRLPLKGIAMSIAVAFCAISVINMVDIAEGMDFASGDDVQSSQSGVYEEITDWWKADLSAYDDTLALVGYEAAPTVTKLSNVSVEPEETQPAETTTETETTETTTAPVEIEAPATEPPVETQPLVVETQPPAPVVSGQFVFTTYGYGHGVGLSQNGANYYAAYSGYNYQQILQLYYPGVTIANTGTAQTEQITVAGVTASVMELLPQVVYREVGSGMSYEAIKAQAVAVYTYIKYNGGGADLGLKGGAPDNVVNACAEVLGEACYYNGSFALTMFYASSGGATASCKDIFTEDLPYLRSVVSEYDASCDGHYGTVKVMDAQSVKANLEASLGITLSDNPANWIQLVEGDGGYISSVIIDGQTTMKGNSFRFCLGLKSPKFTYTFG